MASNNKTKLVIVESPAKAKTIAKFLGRNYKVEASNGHVRDLPKSQIGVDVENDFEPKYITIRGRGEILERIRKEAKGAEKIYLATDPDREGEAISWHLAHILNLQDGDLCRVEFHEITHDAVRAAIKKPRPIDRELVDAQQARRVLDRLVGYTISPLLWAKVRKGLSAGRVQSVATRMIVDRELEIEDFVPEEYWTITARAQAGKIAFDARVYDGDSPRIKGGDRAREIHEGLGRTSFVVAAVKRGESKKNPPPPFTTSNLQQEASRKLNFTTRKTMQVAQKLYEGVEIEGTGTVGLISYIRTDSTRVSREAQEAAKEYLTNVYSADYVPEAFNEYKGRKNAQDAHEAIRPTSLERTPDSVKASLSRDEFRLYKLIFDRFLASQMTPALYDTMQASIKGEEGSGLELRFSGKKKRFSGFTAVYEEGQDEESDDKESQLPAIEPGMQVKLLSAEPEQHFTQPPARYTEASLVKALEEKGIGRPSTYAPTITTILARGYIDREGKALHATELGIKITEMMKEHFSNIVDIAFTADMEEKLDGVEEGQRPWKDVIREFYGPFRQTLDLAEQRIEKVEVKDEPSDIPCDKCGAMMVYKMGRYGRFLACPRFPECRNTKPIVVTIEAPCPACGAHLIERTSKKGRKFYGCEKYPECTFTSWDMPLKEKCSECGSRMVLKRERKGDAYRLCTNEACKHKEPIEPEEGEDE